MAALNDLGGAFDEAVLRLKAAAHRNRTLDAAQVHIVNLDEVIKRVGGHWPRVRDRIRVGSADFLRGCVGPDDIIIPCGDGFLIVFAEGQADALTARCAGIQDLLTAFYTGEEGLEALSAKAKGMTIDASDLAKMVEGAPSPTPPTTPAANRANGDYELILQPIWSARAQAIVCHFCVPSYCQHAAVRHGYDAGYSVSGRHSSEDHAELDAAILDLTCSSLERLIARGGSGVIGASVHASTIRNSRTRVAYLSRLRSVPSLLLQRFIVRISEIEPNTPHSVLSEWVGQLRACVRQVALQLHYSESSLQRFAGTGAWSIGAQLPRHTRETEAHASKLTSDLLTAWARSARANALKLCVENVCDDRSLRIGCAAGVDFFTSDVLWPQRGAPAGA